MDNELATPSPSKRFTSALKGVGGCALYLFGIVAITLLGVMLLKGGVWLSDKVYPWLNDLSAICLAFCVLAFLPLAAFKETRGYGGIGFLYASYAFGATLWVWSLLATYNLWGGFAVAIGLFFLGVGVLPIALLASAIKGSWLLFGELLLVLALTYGTRLFGYYLAAKAEEHDYIDIDTPPEILPITLIVATWLLFAASVIPVIGYVTILPCFICSLILCFKKPRRAKRHGFILLGILIVLFVGALLYGFAHYDELPFKS